MVLYMKIIKIKWTEENEKKHRERQEYLKERFRTPRKKFGGRTEDEEYDLRCIRLDAEMMGDDFEY